MARRTGGAGAGSFFSIAGFAKIKTAAGLGSSAYIRRFIRLSPVCQRPGALARARGIAAGFQRRRI